MSNLPAPGVYTIDPSHSSVGFIARHLVASKVRGQFTDFSGAITIGDTAEASSVEVTVQAASVTTNNETRDNHLRSADFLDLENNPTLTFKSTAVKSVGDGFEVTGDLSIRGVTKSVTLKVDYLGEGPSFTPNAVTLGFEATAEIDRRDFNVNFEGTLENGALVVGNKVVLDLAIEASNAA